MLRFLVPTMLVPFAAIISNGCHGQTSDKGEKQPVTKVALNESEFAALFLTDSTVVFKYEAKPGVEVHDVRLALIENGHETMVTDQPMQSTDPTTVKEIVVVFDASADKHWLKMLVCNQGHSSESRILTSWVSLFGKPLTSYGHEEQTKPGSLCPGTYRLLSGTNEVPQPNHPVEYEDAKAPCQIELTLQ